LPITKEKISYSLDLSEKLKKVKRSDRKGVKELVGIYLLDQIFNDTESSKSPVTGKRFKALSKNYKSLKKKLIGSGKADLRLTETMLPSLEANNSTSGVRIEITNDDEIKKAYGHISGFKGHKTIKNGPKRIFLPDDKGAPVKPKGKGPDQFRRSIVKGIDEIINDFIDGD